jgi:acyl carrier protein
MDEKIILIMDLIREVMKQNNRKDTALLPETDILKDTSLDSLDLAQVIVMLEEKTGKDPFAKGFITFHTIQELAALYE